MMISILLKAQTAMLQHLESAQQLALEDDDESPSEFDPPNFSAPLFLMDWLKSFLSLPAGGGGPDHTKFLTE